MLWNVVMKNVITSSNDIHTEVMRMTVIKAKVMDSMHLELEREIGTSEKEVFVKILRRGIVESAEGAWGFDVDSKDFVKDLRGDTSERIMDVIGGL